MFWVLSHEPEAPTLGREMGSLLLALPLCSQPQREWAIFSPRLSYPRGQRASVSPSTTMSSWVTMLLGKVLRSKVDRHVAQAHPPPSEGEKLLTQWFGDEPCAGDRPLQPWEMCRILRGGTGPRGAGTVSCTQHPSRMGSPLERPHLSLA